MAQTPSNDAGPAPIPGDPEHDPLQRQLRRTATPRVIEPQGPLAGLFRLDFNEKLFQRNYKDPVLVSCLRGLGPKALLAAQMGRFDTLGHDVAALAINDLIARGAEPLFFQLRLAGSRLPPDADALVLKSAGDACLQAGAALLGRELDPAAQALAPGTCDVTGFAMGVCELSRKIEGARAEPGDVLLALPSSGLHAAGFALALDILSAASLDPGDPQPDVDASLPLGQILLTPTRLYARSMLTVLHHYTVKHVVTSLCHVADAGLPRSLRPTLHAGVNARISRKTWPTPPLFPFLQKIGRLSDTAMLDAFNLGIGFTLTVRPAFVDSVIHQLQKHGERPAIIGQITRGTGNVLID